MTTPVAGPPRQGTCSVLLVVIGLLAGNAHATLLAPLDLEELARGSAGVITGVVQEVTGVETSKREIVTLVEVRVTDVLRGRLAAPVITLKEDGGKVGERISMVYGSPRFRRGEQILVFLDIRADGSLRTREMSLGKFTMVGDGFAAQGVRDLGPGASILLGPGELPPPRKVSMTEIRVAIARANAAPVTRSLPLTAPPEVGDLTLAREPVALDAGPLEYHARFFEVDEGLPVGMFIDEENDSFLGPGAGRQVWHAAMTAWTNVPTASIVLWDAGGDYPPQGPLLSFRDHPFSDGCNSGVIGVGGWSADATEVKQFGGMTFVRTIAAFAIVYRDRPECNGLYTRCNVAEVATHEVGHAIGLDHSSDPDATMSGGPAFDCRCASLRDDDAQVLSQRYPLATPPTVTTPAMLPDATVGMPYQFQLAAIGGTRMFAWAFGEDGVNPGEDDFRPGLVLSPEGLLSGVPVDTFFPGDYVERGLIKVTDTNGDSHTKRFFLRINPAGVTTTTATSTTTSTAVPPTGDDPIPCETTTTSTLPSSCDRESDLFNAVRCKASEGKRLVASLPGQHARVARLLMRVIHRCDVAHVETMKPQGNLKKVLKLLDRSERDVRRLGRFLGRARFVNTAGHENAETLSRITFALLTRLEAVRTLLLPAAS